MIATEVKSPADAFAENYLNLLGQVCWAQEQGDKVVKAWIEMGATSREETRQVVIRLAEQIRKNQEEMQKWVQSAVNISLAAFRPATAAQFEAFAQKVEDLNKKVESIGKK